MAKQKVHWFRIQSRRYPNQHEKAGVALPSFDAPHVRQIDLCGERQLFLC